MLNHPPFGLIDAVTEPLGNTFHVIRYMMIVGHICRSSTNLWYSTACVFSMSCIDAVYTMNSSGPRTEPCGTHYLRGRSSDVPVPICTRWLRSDMYELNHVRAEPDIPRWSFIVFNGIDAPIVSKAAEKSRRIRRTPLEPVRELVISCCTLIKAVSVLCRGL